MSLSKCTKVQQKKELIDQVKQEFGRAVEINLKQNFNQQI